MRTKGLFIVIAILAVSLLPADPGGICQQFWEWCRPLSGNMLNQYGFYVPVFGQYHFIFWKEAALAVVGIMAIRFWFGWKIQKSEDRLILEVLLETQQKHEESAPEPAKSYKEDGAPSSFDDDYGEYVDPPCTRNEQEILEQVRLALCTCEDIYIQYLDSRGNKTLRRVSPLEIYYNHGSIYLRAYCAKRQDERSFRIDRILNVWKEKDSDFPLEGVSS